jgi:hypothetical protein
VVAAGWSSAGEDRVNAEAEVVERPNIAAPARAAIEHVANFLDITSSPSCSPTCGKEHGRDEWKMKRNAYALASVPIFFSMLNASSR